MKNKNVKDEKKEKKIGLTTKIFIALLLGAVFGIVLCYLIPDSKVKNDIIVEGILYVIGQGFIRLMKMLVVPLVFCSLVCGSMAIGDTKKLGTVGVRTLVFYLATTALAVTVALSVGNLINPGIGLDMSAIKTSASTVETMEATSLTDTILNIIPDNPINSLASGTMLQVIVFALIIGVILAKMGDTADPIPFGGIARDRLIPQPQDPCGSILVPKVRMRIIHARIDTGNQNPFTKHPLLGM